jgi:hypothetical protein
MKTKQMIEIILAFEKELKENYDENRNAFGYADKDTERAGAKWIAMDELLNRLKITK